MFEGCIIRLAVSVIQYCFFFCFFFVVVFWNKIMLIIMLALCSNASGFHYAQNYYLNLPWPTVFIIKKFPLRCRTTSVERSSVVKKTVCERFMNAKQAFALNGPIKRT